MAGSGRPRRLTVRLEADDTLPGEFAPFRLPRRLSATLTGVDGGVLRGLDLVLAGALSAGRHALPIGREAALEAEVAPGTRFNLALQVGDEDDTAVLTQGELRFEPPVVLGNVPGVLAALPTLFEDRRLAAVTSWLDRLAARDVPGGVAATLRRVIAQAAPWLRAPGADPGPPGAFARFFASTEQLARIHLGAVRLRPTAHGTRCELAFEGYVSWIDQLPLPFVGVSLPSAIIPALHRRLDLLISSNPLATAALHNERLARPADLALAFGRLLAAAEGHASFALDTFTTALQLRLADGTELTAEVPPLGRAVGHADLGLVRSGDRLEATLSRAALALPSGEAHGELRWAGPLPGADTGADAPWTFAFTAGPGTHLDRLEVLVGQRHAEVRGERRATLALSDVVVAGHAAFGAEDALALDTTCAFALAGERRDPHGRVAPRALGRAATALRRDPDGTVTFRVEAEAAGQVTADLTYTPVSELGLTSGAAHGEAAFEVRATATAHVRRQRDGRRVADLGGSAATVTLEGGALDADGRRLTLPAGAVFEARALTAELGDDGLGHARASLAWELGSTPLTLSAAGETMDLLPDRARRGIRELTLSAAGGLGFAAPGAATPGAPPAPGRDLGQLLADETLTAPLLGAARLLAPGFGADVAAVHRYALRVRRVLREQGITEPRHALPHAALVRLVAGLLGDAPELVAEADPIVAAVTRGDGLDVSATLALLERALPPNHGWHHALHRVIDWLAVVLGPTEALAPRTPIAAQALCEDPALRPLIARYPSAAALYAAAEGAALPGGGGLAQALPTLAPYLGREQLEALLDVAEATLPAAVRARARYVAELSRRARLVASSYGGLAHLPQALAIGVFLGDAALVARATCAPHPGPVHAVTPADAAAVCDTLLGPAAVAVLLQAGLTPVLQGRAVQLNQRLLLDDMFARPPAFTLQVLVELSAGSTRILTNALNALLDLEQDLMREPLDLHAALSERLGLPIPRRADHMAGGSNPRESYYGALHHTARQILTLGRPYLALRQHLQQARGPSLTTSPVRPHPTAAPASGVDEASARRAIADADGFAGALDLRAVGDDTRTAAIAGYTRAFERVAALLAAAPAALAAPWLRDFLGRNHDALTVLRVVQNHRDDVDAVRRWLTVRTGLDTFATEQDLVDAVLAALYAPPEAAALGADPLVRLLVPHPEGALDFTIVSCMGVITDGARGRELADTFARLTRERGVHLVRADTATFRSLDDNARRVEAAVAHVTTPWGWLGYSQGCANGYAAESRLAGGTPAQRRLLAGLRCRHLLFSAANGSTHGSSADLKFLRAMVVGDLALKRYQADLSGPVIELALRALRIALDSRAAVTVLGGARSLSHDGVLALGRDGVFLPHLPTTAVRGRAAPETLPEALEMLGNLLTRQSGSSDHDTQVAVDDAVPWPRYVDNAATEQLAASSVPSRVQATHHWAPLGEDVAFVRTPRDEARAIYDGPRDRLVFPWVEFGARFGFIPAARVPDER